MNWTSNLPSSVCTSSDFWGFSGHSCSPTWAWVAILMFLGLDVGWLIRDLLCTWLDRR